MSLLFDHALSNFSPVGGHHYEVTADDFASAKERVPVKPIVEFAQHHDLAFPGDDEYISIPLHGTDNATPTGSTSATPTRISAVRSSSIATGTIADRSVSPSLQRPNWHGEFDSGTPTISRHPFQRATIARRRQRTIAEDDRLELLLC